MPSVHGTLFAVFDVILLFIILLRINWLPDFVNFIIVFILAAFAAYEIVT